MAVLLSDFVGALSTVKAAGGKHYVGSFCLENDQTQPGSPGPRWTQSRIRIDPLGYDAPYYSPGTGGMRYWPTSKAGIRKLAERLLADETAEMNSRWLHLKAVA